MFYCDVCRGKYAWPDSLCKSIGPCEMCGVTAMCNDVPSSLLPDTGQVEESTEVEGTE